MKLELKHLAPYLPYGLKMYWENLVGEALTPWTLTPSKVKFALEMQNKPILRPLSDFEHDDVIHVEEYLGLGQWCDYYDQYFIIWFDDAQSVQELALQCPYVIMQYFFKHHFDVFGLIPQGLAIDINTLNK